MMHKAKRPEIARFLIILSLMAVLVVSSGCTEDPDNNEDEKVTVNLGMPELAPRNTGTAQVHDATLTVNIITPRDTKAAWTDFEVLIKDSMGSLLLAATPLQEDTGAYGDTVEVWYKDTTGKRNVMDAGDSIIISGMDAATYEGAHVTVNYKDFIAATTIMPTDFP